MVDQPTASRALEKLEPLLGEWTLAAASPDGSRGPAKPGPASSGTTPAHTLLRARESSELHQAR
jgi:hypothetical protein